MKVMGTAGHPVDLSSGRVLGHGETADIDVDNDHDKALLDSGQIREVSEPEQPRRQRRQGGDRE